jgi:hypothetical protein
MIVGSRFPGDDDHHTMGLQHDCYGEALVIMHRTVFEALIGAYTLLAIAPPEKVLSAARQSFDHRTVQAAHDHLAAYWRAQTGRTYPSLPLAETEDQDTISSWLAWLQVTTSQWPRCDVSLAQMFSAAIVHANTPEGYRAEQGLASALATRYPLPR